MKLRNQILASIAWASVVLGLAAANQESARLNRRMGWKAGQTIADIGAGEGEIGCAADKIVGGSGKVYVTELHQLKRAGWKNVAVVQGAEKKSICPTTAARRSCFDGSTTTSQLPWTWMRACCGH